MKKIFWNFWGLTTFKYQAHEVRTLQKKFFAATTVTTFGKSMNSFHEELQIYWYLGTTSCAVQLPGGWNINCFWSSFKAKIELKFKSLKNRFLRHHFQLLAHGCIVEHRCNWCCLPTSQVCVSEILNFFSNSNILFLVTKSESILPSALHSSTLIIFGGSVI